MAEASPQPSRSEQPRVSVVIPIHNGIEHTEACLESLERSAYPEFEIVIVDDGSTDGSAERIAARFPQVRILSGDGNLWWGGAVNVGIEDSVSRGADYVLTLNHDTTVDPEMIGELVRAATRHGRALIGAKIYDGENRDRVWFFGARLDPATGDVVHVQGHDRDFVEETDAEALTGMGLLIPAGAFGDVGLVDVETFPQYMSDTDLTLRARKRGYRLVVSPAAKVYADPGSSWSEREFAKGELSLVPKLFLLERSPYSISIRRRFYKRYFPDRYLIRLLRYYLVLTRMVVLPHIAHSLKASARRRRGLSRAGAG